MSTQKSTEQVAAAPTGNVLVLYWIVVRSTDPRFPLTKRIWLDAVGEMVKVAAASPSKGKYAEVTASGDAESIIDALITFLRTLTAYDAIMIARLPSPRTPDGQLWRLRTKKSAPDPKALARSQDNFHAVAGPALGFLDIDVPAAMRSVLRTADAVRALLIDACPELARTAMLIRASVSAGAKKAGTANPLPTGWHVFFVIDDGRQLAAFATALFNRLATLGYALVEPSKRGAKLRRALVDPAASQGAERLIFEADPMISDGILTVPRLPARFPGGVFYADDALERLKVINQATREERRAIWKDAEAKASAACAAARKAWLEARGEDLAKKHRVSITEARVTAEAEYAAFDAGELTDDCRINLDDGSEPTVYQILSNPKRYEGARGPSIDEFSPRPGVTYIWPYCRRPDPTIGRPAGPYLHSFEHGGRFWTLRSARAEREQVRRLVEQLFTPIKDKDAD